MGMAVPAAALSGSPAPALSPRLEARGLVHRYGERRVLDGVSFAVPPGEVFGILGRNGAGKSTLFSVLTGLLPPGDGALFLDGAAIRPGDRALRARLGVVFQAPSLDPKLTAMENLLLGAALFRVGAAEARERAKKLLDFAELSDRSGDPAGKLSGGMRRRLEICRALLPRPAILLMDEPTAGLDAPSFARTWERLLGLRAEEGLTLLVTTHNPAEAEKCDRLAVLERGRIAACETPESLRSRVLGDVIEIAADAPDALAAELRDRLGLAARATATGVVLERDRGHELVPRLVEAFPAGRFLSVSMRRPSLADAFLRLTGTALEVDEA
jgi:ABC-2 type transport system ATP-binding protein